MMMMTMTQAPCTSSREAERQISNHPKGGSGRSYSLEEDGTNGSDTVDLSWLSIEFVDLPYSIHLRKHLQAHD